MEQKNPGRQVGVIRLPANINKLLIYFLLCWVFLAELLTSMARLPGTIRYLNDLVMVWLLVHCLLNQNRLRNQFRTAGYKSMLVILGIYTAYLIVGVILNSVRLPLVVWGMRNTYRCFAYFIVCVFLLDREDLDQLLKFLCDLQWLNLALSLFQYFILHRNQDWLGGLFGITIGCNAYLNVYLCFVTAYVTLRYTAKQCSLQYLIFSLLNTMVVAGLSELKIVFLELVLIVLAVMALSPRRSRVFNVVLIAGVAGVVGLLILRQLFPHHFNILASFDRLLEYSSSQSGGYNLSRIHAFENINNLFFQDSVFYNLFGFGMGSCEYSSFSFLTSDFYRRYGAYNYRWFTHQMLFLETGYLGIGLYLSVIGSILLSAWRNRKKNLDNCFHANLTLIMGMITVICIWYNATTITEAGYLLFFPLTADAIVSKSLPADAGDGKPGPRL